MKVFTLAFLALFLTSCVPLAIAPDLSEGKIIRGKKFRKKLPNRHSYAFTDPKDADEFYYYINTKYQLDHDNVTNNVPVKIDGKQYYMSFYETGKSSKTINLIPILVDVKLESEDIKRDGFRDNHPLLEDFHTSRSDTYYILVMITDQDFNDALHPEYEFHKEVAQFATGLKDEYLSMANYNQAILPSGNN